MITDNGKQFTDGFSRHGPSRGEVLFDKICRRNAITHRLTSRPRRTRTGRSNGSMAPSDPRSAPPGHSPRSRRRRPRSTRGSRNTTASDRIRRSMSTTRWCQRTGSPPPTAATWSCGSPSLHIVETPEPEPDTNPIVVMRAGAGSGSPIDLERPVPAAGNMWLGGQQIWLGTARAGEVVRFWVDCDWIHLSIAGRQVKSVRSQLTVADLDKLVARGAVAAGPPPQDVEATVSRRASWKWSGPSPGEGRSRSAPAWCWPPGFSAVGGLACGSRTAHHCCSSTPRPANCCGPDRTRSSPARQ